MEKLSRVKKYEGLRKSIETENVVSESIDDAMEAEQQGAFQKFDSSILKKVTIVDEETYIPVREKQGNENQETSVIDDTFTNEYLDDFIREVREYNIKNGNRESDDTQVDILAQLNAANREKRMHYVEPIEDKKTGTDETVIDRVQIAQEVQNLLHEDATLNETVLNDDIYATTELLVEDIVQEDDSTVAPILKKENEIFSQSDQSMKEQTVAKKIIKPLYDMDMNSIYDTTSFNTVALEPETVHKKLMEETQQLRVQMDEYEDELTDLSDGVEKNNKLLNFILCFLILVLLVIIGFIGYYIWKGGGI